MESESSIILESCQEDSMLIETVKNIVTGTANNELESEVDGFFVVTDVQDQQQNTIEIANEPGAIQVEDRLTWPDLCRICANVNDHLIPIFEGEGLQHELCTKIHKYLPIHVSQDDTLPLQLCYHCAATLLAWHELSEGCLNAERRLLEVHNTLQEKRQFFNATSSDGLVTAPQDATSVLNSTESLPQEQGTVKDEDCTEVAVNSSDRSKTESNGVVQVPTIEIESTNGEEVKYIVCAHCDIIFVDVKCFTNHMNAEHDAQMHYCQYCKLVYRGSIKDFDEHASIHYTSHEVTQDTPADLVYEYENGKGKDAVKNEEIILTSVEIDKPPHYTCHLCERIFTKKNELRKHINSHSDAKRIQSTDETELVNQAKQVIDYRVSYKCHVCKKLIFTRRGFLRHIRVHSGTRPCKCDLCGKYYRIEQDLARHIRDVHEGVKKYTCDICNRPFANKGARDDHRRIHTGERPYACEYCPKTFRTLNSIYIHNRIHINYKPHKCTYCGKSFSNKQRLANHETTHTGVKAFACDICGKMFSVKGEVVRHRPTHSQEKPFDCKGCAMSFSQKRYLRNHIKQHHKDESSFLLSELANRI